MIPVLGGKEGVAHVALATLDPGDTALAPDPGYPPYTSGPLFSGANVHYLPLAEENDFLPDLEALLRGSCSSSTTRTTRPARRPRSTSSSARVAFARASAA